MTTVDMTGAQSKLANIAKQSNFAASQSLNDGAIAGQKALLGEYADRFTLRRPEFFRMHGARLTRSTKANLVAEVGTTDAAKFLSKHLTGGQHGPADGQGKLAIPLSAVRRTKKDLIPTSQRPRALVAAGAFFKGPRDGLSQLAKAVGRGKAKTVRTFYLLVRTVRIKPVLRPALDHASEQALTAARESFPKRFADAMRTAK